MPDLATLLAVVAQCSATFVAIIGGLVANKAVNDTAEEASLREQMEKLDREIQVLEQQNAEIEHWLAQEAAQDFISEHFKSLLGGVKLDKVQGADSDDYISREKLQPLWNEAQKGVRACVEARRRHPGSPVDASGVPEELTKELSDFVKDVCRRNRSEIARQSQSGDQMQDRVEGSPESSSRQAAVAVWNEALDEQDDTVNQIARHRTARELLSERLEGLSKRPMVRKGRTMFLWVALLDVVLPLVLFLFIDSIPSEQMLWGIAAVVLVLFACGIFAMSRFLTQLYRFGDAVPRDDTSN